MERLIGRLTCSQVIATVLTLGWATCPMAFAVERGKQVVREVVTDKLSRVYGRTTADSLVGQFRVMNIGSLTKVGSTVVLELSGATYVFDQMARNVDGGISGLVTTYDSDGQKVADYNILNIASPDANRVDYSISASTSEGDWIEDGALVGIQGNPGTAIALTSVDGGDSRASLVDFSGLAASDQASAALPMLTITPLQDSYSTQGGVACVDPCTACLVTGCVVLAAIIVYTLFCLVVSMLGSLWSCY